MKLDFPLFRRLRTSKRPFAMKNSFAKFGCSIVIVATLAFWSFCAYNIFFRKMPDTYHISRHSGGVTEKGFVTNGLKHGLYEYSNSDRSAKGRYWFGAKIGVWTNWYSGNRLASILYYDDAAEDEDGNWYSTITNAWYYDENGRLVSYQKKGLDVGIGLYRRNLGYLSFVCGKRWVFLQTIISFTIPFY